MSIAAACGSDALPCLKLPLKSQDLFFFLGCQQAHGHMSNAEIAVAL